MRPQPANGAAFDNSIHTRRFAPGEVRFESDSLGSVGVPADAYWGGHTARALENFAISGHAISEYPDLIYAYACVKQAAVRANRELGVIPTAVASLIDAAAQEIKAGAFLDQFVVDVIQGGAGTATNMNVNEVIANRALELGGHTRGEYGHLGPVEDVGLNQRTSDTYPTALKLAMSFMLDRLLSDLRGLQRAFQHKARQFADIPKVGRTQLQDAAPMTLGQEFEVFAITLGGDHAALRALKPWLCEISLGVAGVGTAITADPRFAQAARRHLSEITGIELRAARHLPGASADMGAFMQVSSCLKQLAMRLAKICNDLRLLSSGPQFGLGEIQLPARQPEPGVAASLATPVIPEVVNEVCFSVAAADGVVAMAAEAGQLQLNAFEPIIGHAVLMSLKWLTAATITLRRNCIVGITPNADPPGKQTASEAAELLLAPDRSPVQDTPGHELSREYRMRMNVGAAAA